MSVHIEKCIPRMDEMLILNTNYCTRSTNDLFQYGKSCFPTVLRDVQMTEGILK